MTQRIRHVEGPALGFWCTGCRRPHIVELGEGGWSWNGDMSYPTLSPSVHVNAPGTEHHNPKSIICHSFIANGQIQYLTDCTHTLKGQTVVLEEVEDGYFNLFVNSSE